MAEEQKTYRYDFVDEGTGNRRRAIRTGSAWSKPLRFLEADKVTPKDVSSWDFQMMVRKTLADDTIIIELSTANNRITKPGGGTDGWIALELTAAETSALLDSAGINEYDLKYIESGVTKDSIEGQLEIRASATRS